MTYGDSPAIVGVARRRRGTRSSRSPARGSTVLAPCRVDDVRGPDAPAEHGGADGAGGEHAGRDDERAAACVRPVADGGRGCDTGRARGARRSSTTSVATPATTASTEATIAVEVSPCGSLA